MEHVLVDRVTLDRVDQGRGRLVIADGHIDQGVGAGLAVELGELQGIDRDRLRGALNDEDCMAWRSRAEANAAIQSRSRHIRATIERSRVIDATGHRPEEAAGGIA